MKRSNDTVKNQYALKRGLRATLLTVVFVVAVVLVNVFFTILSDNFPLGLDLTTDMKNTLSEDNIDYLETVDKEVKIYAIGSETDFTGGYIQSFMQNYMYVTDEDGYITQTARLLKEYPKYNSNISVEFLDASSKDFELVSANYSGYTYGDLLVESTFEVDGKEVTRRKLLNYEDLYALDTTYASYGVISINGSNIESALGSAIYSVTLAKTVTIGIPVEYCGNSDIFFQYIEDTLDKNNYEIVTVEGLDIEEFSSDLDAILVYDPKMDFPSVMIDALDKFIDNDGKYGKAFYYLPSASTVDRPNINEFLEEWGMSYVKDSNGKYATLYYDDSKYPTYTMFESLETDYTKGFDSGEKYALAENVLAMAQVNYETYGSRTSTEVFKSPDSALLCPVDAGDSWEPLSNAKAASYSTLLITDRTVSGSSSYVVGFGSSMFVETGFNATSYSSAVGNTDILLEILNYTNSQESAPFSFSQKTISMGSFVATDTEITLWSIVLFVIVPSIFIFLAVFVTIRRKRR